MPQINGWAVSSFLITGTGSGRKERRLEEIPPEELKAIARRMNISALAAAAYKEVAVGA